MTGNLRRRAAVVGAYLLALAGGTLVGLLRESGTPAWRTIWAEDGSVFYAQAKWMPLWQTFTRPYNGYMHAVPRLLAALAALLPASDAAAAMAVLAAATVSGIALAVHRASGDFVERPAVRFALAAAVLLLPAGTGEMANAVANLHFYLDYLAFWLVLWRPATRTGSALAALAMALAVMSDPLVVVLVPLVVLRAVRATRPRDRLMPLAYVAGGVVQLLAVLSTTRSQPGWRPGPGVLAGRYSVRVVLGLFTGWRGQRWVFTHAGWVAVGLAWLVLAAMLVRSLRTTRSGAGGGDRRFVGLAAFLASLAFCFPFWESPGPRNPVDLDWGSMASLLWTRYDVAPTLLLTVVAAMALDLPRAPAPAPAHRARTPAWRALPAATAVALAVLAAVWLVDFRVVPNPRGRMPTWSHLLSLASRQCEEPARISAEVLVPPGLRMTLPCGSVPAVPRS